LEVLLISKLNKIHSSIKRLITVRLMPVYMIKTKAALWRAGFFPFKQSF